MSRERKEGTYLNIKLEQSLYDKLSQYSKETGIPKTTITEKALDAYFSEKGYSIEAEKEK